MQTIFTEVRTTRQYLVVKFQVRGQLVPHTYTVRVPWRSLNERYQDVVEHLEDEAQAELRRQNPAAWLPLETWE